MSNYKVNDSSAVKTLIAEGKVVDANGNVIDSSDYWKKVYDQAEPKILKFLHADGTIDENEGGGSSVDLEDNHESTIDVSTYTEPVEIIPTEGKDGMKKCTVILSNIPSPSGGGNTLNLYGWNYYADGTQYNCHLPITEYSENMTIATAACYYEDSARVFVDSLLNLPGFAFGQNPEFEAIEGGFKLTLHGKGDAAWSYDFYRNSESDYTFTFE